MHEQLFMNPGPDSKVHWRNMGPIWGRRAPCGPHELCYRGGGGGGGGRPRGIIQCHENVSYAWMHEQSQHSSLITVIHSVSM